MAMDPLLQLLRENAKYSSAELAELASLNEAEVAERLASWEKDGTILGYHAVIDAEKAGDLDVSAFMTSEEDFTFKRTELSKPSKFPFKYVIRGLDI